jgi:molecular chaperone Hsp33
MSAPFADALARFVFDRAAIRGAVVSLDAACAGILDSHPYPPALRRALAELLAAAALLASTLKFNGTLAVQLQGDGPVRLLVVECDAELNLRATAQWSEAAAALRPDAPLAALAGGPGHGRLAITLDPKDGGPLYQGIVALQATSVATLIEHYLATSEQIASRLLLAASEGRARGLLLQRMPGSGDGDLETWESVAARFDRLDRATLLAAPAPAALVAAGFPEHDVRLFAPRPARFACTCSAERVAGALRLLGRDEVEHILAEQGTVSVTCEFCNRRYAYDAIGARTLFPADDRDDDAVPSPPPRPH